ncbi:MAG: hypothetical protein IPK83_08345 [Planctomycetes bacterium]|nr:hypothetical protein [Planctomycetota bacterium]
MASVRSFRCRPSAVLTALCSCRVVAAVGFKLPAESDSRNDRAFAAGGIPRYARRLSHGFDRRLRLPAASTGRMLFGGVGPTLRDF